MKFLTSALFAVLTANYSTKSAHAFGLSTQNNNGASLAFPTINVGNKHGSISRQRLTVLAAEASKITMPALSSTMKEGRVVSWLKQEGDEVEAGEAIMVVESDKADMDVEAFEDGFIAKILVGEGESAPVGDTVALLAAEEDEIELIAAMGDAGDAAPAAVEEEAAAPAAGESVQNEIYVEFDEYTQVFMPALSSTMSEGKIVSWLKEEGDEVSAGEPIMVVESDKADMDVEAFEDGFLASIVVEEGSTVDVGAPVGIIVSNEEDISKISAQTSSHSSSTSVALPASDTHTASVSEPDCDFSQVDMPALSSTMKEGKVVSWLKAEGDPISAGEAIMVVESDKADMDVEAFEDGFLAAIITEEGESSDVGAPVALIAAEESDIPSLQAYAATLGGAAAGAPAAAPAPAAAAAPSPKAAVAKKPATTGDRVVASPLAKKKAEELGIDLSTVVGSGPDGRVTASDVENASSGTAPAKSTPAAKPSWTPAAGVVAATPTARAAAKKARIDIATIVGTGEFGRVTIDDVKMATGEVKPKRKAPVRGGAEPVELPEGLVPFTGMQRAVSKNMEATLSTPIFRVSREIEMDAFNALYQSVKPKGVTVSALLAKAVALALEKYPVINSSYSSEGTVYNSEINVAMAVAIDGGLITPTLKYANERNIIELGENWKVSLINPYNRNTWHLQPDITHCIAHDNRSLLERRRQEHSPPTNTSQVLLPYLTLECSVSVNLMPSFLQEWEES